MKKAQLKTCAIVIIAFAGARCGKQGDLTQPVGIDGVPASTASAIDVEPADARRSGIPIPLNTPDAGEPPALSCGGLLGTSDCDPVTSWPCNTVAGEICEYSNSGGAFRCYSVPTAVVPLCGFCDREIEFCALGMTCGGSRCERYCCADTDCGQGICARDLFYVPELAAVGLCVSDSIAQCGPNPAFTEWLPALAAGAVVDAGAELPDADD